VGGLRLACGKGGDAHQRRFTKGKTRYLQESYEWGARGKEDKGSSNSGRAGSFSTGAGAQHVKALYRKKEPRAAVTKGRRSKSRDCRGGGEGSTFPLRNHHLEANEWQRAGLAFPDLGLWRDGRLDLDAVLRKKKALVQK